MPSRPETVKVPVLLEPCEYCPRVMTLPPARLTAPLFPMFAPPRARSTKNVVPVVPPEETLVPTVLFAAKLAPAASERNSRVPLAQLLATRTPLGFVPIWEPAVKRIVPPVR